MGLITEIRKKSREVESPELDIRPDDSEKLKRGEAIIVSDKSDTPFLIRIDSDKVGFNFTDKDLIIEKLKIPKVAKERSPEL